MPYTEEALRHTIARVRQVSGLPGAAARPREPVVLRRVRRLHHAGVGVPGAPGRGRRLRPAARRQQRLRQLVQPRLRSRTRTSTRSPPTASCSTTWPGTRTRARTSSTRTATTRCPRCGSSTRAPAARTGTVATLYEWDEDIPEFEVVHAEALKAARVSASEARARRGALSAPADAPTCRSTACSAGCRPSSCTRATSRTALGSPTARKRARARRRGRRDPALADAHARGARRDLPGHVPRCAWRRRSRPTTRASSTSWATTASSRLVRGLRAGPSVASYTPEPRWATTCPTSWRWRPACGAATSATTSRGWSWRSAQVFDAPETKALDAPTIAAVAPEAWETRAPRARSPPSACSRCATRRAPTCRLAARRRAPTIPDARAQGHVRRRLPPRLRRLPARPEPRRARPAGRPRARACRWARRSRPRSSAAAGTARSRTTSSAGSASGSPAACSRRSRPRSAFLATARRDTLSQKARRQEWDTASGTR